MSTPFEPTTTPNIERANRLISVKTHPGFLDILRLSKELVNEAVEVCLRYPGWDAQQIVILKVRMQAAQEHHDALLSKIHNAIEIGIAEDADKNAPVRPEKSAVEVLEQGDLVRQEVLKKFEEQDLRAAGSY